MTWSGRPLDLMDVSIGTDRASVWSQTAASPCLRSTSVPAHRAQAQPQEHQEDDDGDGLGRYVGQPDEEGAEDPDHQCAHHAAHHQVRGVVAAARDGGAVCATTASGDHHGQEEDADVETRPSHRGAGRCSPSGRAEQRGHVVHLDRTVVVDALDERVRVELVELGQGETGRGFAVGDVGSVQRESLGEAVVHHDVADVGLADQVDVVQAEPTVEEEQLRIDQPAFGRHRDRRLRWR